MVGVEFLILTNAAGGIHPDFYPGDLVSLSDHINLTGVNPLCGPNDNSLGPRFPDMTWAYHEQLGKIMEEAAREMDYPLKSGVYAGLLGPCYETPAEVSYLRTLGADMVGMSTVLECIAANHMGLAVGALSCITNKAAKRGQSSLNHEEVKEEAYKVRERFSELLQRVIVKVAGYPQ